MDPHRRRVGHRHLVDAHLRRARGVQRRLGVLADPVEDLLVGLHRRARGELAVVERRERRLVEDVAGDPHGLDPLAAVVGGGEVVEEHLRVLLGVGAGDPDPAAGVGVHRADVHLVAVALGRRRCRRSGSRSAGSGTSGWASRRRRCCARSRRPRSGWWRRGRGGGTATGSRCRGGGARPGRARWRPAAWRRTGCRPRGGPGGSRRRRAASCTMGTPSGCRCSGSPTPESCISWGVLIAPPQRITSPALTERCAAAAAQVVDAGRAGAVEADPRGHRQRLDAQVRAGPSPGAGRPAPRRAGGRRARCGRTGRSPPGGSR